MKRKIITLILSAVMLFCTLNVCASVEYSDEFAKDVLKHLDIMKGDENGNLNLDSHLTRAEFAKIAINSSKYKNTVAHGAMISVFQDCTYKHWAAPYVRVAATNKIVTGYPDGTFKPDNTVSLEEAVTVMLRLLGYTDADFGNTWPYGQISLAKGIGLTNNVTKGIGEPITRYDALKIVYNTLNSNVKDSDREYSSDIDVVLHSDVIVMATNKEDSSVSYGKVLTSAGTFKCDDSISEFVGLKGSLAVGSGGEVICFTPDIKNGLSEYVVYSVLSNSIVAYHNGQMTELKVSSGTPVYSGSEKLTFESARAKVEIGDVIYAVTAANGSVDYLTLTKDSLEGPDVLYSYTDSWYTKYTADTSSLSVIRNGEKVGTDKVKTYDVLYYSRELNTVFAYAKTVTGIYENALPGKDAPTSVVVSGVQYEIESVEAFQKLSSIGDLNYGSSVTLLLGKSGKIADVLASEKAGDTSEIVGYLVDTGKKQFEKDGENYTSRYVSIVLTDGSQTEYKTDYDYSSSLNSIVKVTFKNNLAVISRVNTTYVSGMVDADEMRIGSNAVSNDIQILDVNTTRADHKGTAISTYMERLDGVTLSNASVLWYKKNSAGEIVKLILKDVTGDGSVYGIVTDLTEPSENSQSTNASYTIDSNGSQFKYSGGLLSDITYITPVKMNVSGSAVQSLSALAPISGKITNITSYAIEAGNTQYLLSDKVIVYKQLSLRNYVVMTLSELMENYEDYIITAYTNKVQRLGGRVRIILVR